MKSKTSTIKQNPLITKINTKDEAYWDHTEKQMRLKLFHEMATGVPAYKNFLKEHSVRPALIKTVNDLAQVPPITKDNYLRKYSLKEKSWGGKLNDGLVLTSTSGSTGTPVYFTRSETLDRQSSLVHELYLSNAGFDQREPTLVIIAFGMGVWIGGMITYQAFKYLQEGGHPLSIITPGINKAEIIRIFEHVAPNYKQILMAGYPPFIKDVIDDLNRIGLKPKHAKMRLLFAAEAFSETFRTHVATQTGITEPLLDTMNIYGSADIGTMAFETPLSIAIRRQARRSQSLFREVFTDVAKTPTLAQYIPSNISFESVGGTLLITGNNSIPLCRYQIGDHGGRFSYNQVSTIFDDHQIKLNALSKQMGIQNYHYKLPFVYVYERMDFSTTLYGLQVYPEPIREVLMKTPFNKYFTGKFTMVTQYDSKHDQYLEINFEMQHDVTTISAKLEKELLSSIIKRFEATNAEFKELHNHLGQRAIPKCVFWNAEDTTYFKPGVKQKWVIKK